MKLEELKLSEEDQEKLELCMIAARMAQQMHFYMEEIQDEIDKDVLEVYISAMQVIENEMTALLELPQSDIRTGIRNGQGDLRKIKDKCILLKLV